MNCTKDDLGWGGRCCCNCANLLEDYSHPCTDGGRITQQRGWVCLAPEFSVENPTGRGVAFSGWREHGLCEQHDFRERKL